MKKGKYTKSLKVLFLRSLQPCDLLPLVLFRRFYVSRVVAHTRNMCIVVASENDQHGIRFPRMQKEIEAERKFSPLVTAATPLRSPHIIRKQDASAFVFSALDGEKARLLDFEPPTVMRDDDPSYLPGLSERIDNGLSKTNALHRHVRWKEVDEGRSFLLMRGKVRVDRQGPRLSIMRESKTSLGSKRALLHGLLAALT